MSALKGCLGRLHQLRTSVYKIVISLTNTQYYILCDPSVTNQVFPELIKSFPYLLAPCLAESLVPVQPSI